MNIAEIFIYPGIAFLILTGILLSGILRKLAARMQSRIGPPIIQPLYDILKLLSKENIRPKQAKQGFTLWPAISLVSLIVTGLMVPIAGITALGAGDIIVIVYFLAFGSFAAYLSGFVSGNPFGAIGASRGIMQMISYEFPFIMALLFPVVFLNTLSIAELNAMQITTGIWNIMLFPIAGVIFLLAMLAALEIPPFHIPSAHQEIVGGYSVEYTGTRLAYLELAHMVKLVVVLSIAIAVFLGGANTIYVFGAKLLALIFSITLVRVLMARLRIDTGLRFYWALGYILIADYVLRLLL